jgi:hypothetical protein
LSWAERHRSRLDRVFGVRDPWRDQHDDWTDAELRSWAAAAEHLRALDLYGSWQAPASARQAWRCQRCPCRREVA